MKLAVFGLGVALALWGVSGLVLARGMGETGFFYGPDYLVRRVLQESGAEAAGIQVGDRVLSVGGVPVTELPMQSRQRERPVGASEDIVVERETEVLTLGVAYREIPKERMTRAFRALTVNLAFLGAGVWAYLLLGTPLALVLAGIGLARAAAGFPGPHLGPTFEGLGSSLQMLGTVALSFLLLRFFLDVPRRRRVLESGRAQRVLWIGMAIAAITCIVEMAVHPAWYMASGFILMALVLPVYLLLFIMVPWSWFKASPAERRSSGLSLMLFGYLIGLGPVILRLVLEGPLGMTIPGSDWIPLVEVAVPFFLALGVRRNAVFRPPSPILTEPLAPALS